MQFYDYMNPDEKIHYVYRFWNDKGQVIYVGKATHLYDRLYNHHHLPKECYKSIRYIDFSQLETESDALLYEYYYICKLLPKYNTKDKPNIPIKTVMEDLTFLPFKEEYVRMFPTNMKFKNIDLMQLENFGLQFNNKNTDRIVNVDYVEFRSALDSGYTVEELYLSIENYLKNLNVAKSTLLIGYDPSLISNKIEHIAYIA